MILVLQTAADCLFNSYFSSARHSSLVTALIPPFRFSVFRFVSVSPYNFYFILPTFLKMPASTVAQYLAALPADRRAALSAARKVIKENLPHGYEEGMQF